MATARDLVTSGIAAEVKRFPDLDFSPLDTAGLDARDAALAIAIDQAVRRHWLALERVCESQLSRPWEHLEAKLKAALLVGAAQLLLMDRIPDHAAINDAVDWAKRNVRQKAGGLVNAVLRRIADLRRELLDGPYNDPSTFIRHDGRAWKLTEAVFDADPLIRLAQQTSHPHYLIERWVKQFGSEKARTIAMHSLVHAPIILHGLDEQADTAVPHNESGFYIFTGDHASLIQVVKTQSNAIVQDPASAAPCLATLKLQPKVIVDVCAGRGTKTKLLSQIHAESRIIASDINTDHLNTLREDFAQHDRIEIVERDQLSKFNGKADLLVLDVPCSNTGVLARRIEAKYRFSKESLESLVSNQRQVIADSILLLAPAGRLLYSTCSLEKQENQQQAEWIAKWHRMRITDSSLRLPNGLPGDQPTAYSDGGYFAMLRST